MANVRLSDSDTRGFDMFRAIFPVAAVKPSTSGELTEQRFYGTAFAIAPGLFLTAAHVMRTAQAQGLPVIAGPRSSGDEPLGVAQIPEWELWPNDVALLHCPVKDKVTLFDKWRHTRCQVHDELFTFGYPHAITRVDGEDRLSVTFRGYKGHVVTTRGFERLPSKPGVYEVCSPFPEGLSGAPVLWRHEHDVFLVGMVLGEETVRFGRVRNRVGIALPVDEFINCRSQRLNQSLGHLVSVVGVSHDGPAPEY